MSETEGFDAIVIGSGQAGNPLAAAFAAAGKKTALIESRDVGGTCINRGCTPTKTMVASGRVAYLAKRAADFGVVLDGSLTDMRRVRQRKRAIVQNFRSGSEKRLEKSGVQLIRGEASFAGPRSLNVALHEGGARLVNSARIFIDTGVRPAIPPIEGLSRSLFGQ